MDLGAKARIPFRETSVYHSPRTEGGRLWNGELQFFKEHREEFDGDYDERNNVESTNSGVKRLLGSITRSKHPTARVNEVLARAVAYNITCVIHTRYNSGIEPYFGG